MAPREFRTPVPGGEIVGHVYPGDGPDIMFVHNVCDNQVAWCRVAPLLSKFARVVTLDMRGHGQSTCDVEVGNLGQVLDDFALVAEDLRLVAPAIVGHQFGGGVSELAVAKNPSSFGALGLLDSPAITPWSEYGDLLDLFVMDDVQDALCERFGYGACGPDRESMEEFVAASAQKLSSDWLSAAEAPARARRTILRGTLVHPDGSWTRRPVRATNLALVDLPDDFFAFPGLELLETLELPVWVLSPEEGDHTKGVADATRLASTRPGWSVNPLPGGLQVNYTHPEAVVELLAGLLAGRAGSDRDPVRAGTSTTFGDDLEIPAPFPT